MKTPKRKKIGIALGAIGLLLGIGATFFKVVTKVIGSDPNGPPNGWALRLSTAQFILAACLIVTGCFLMFVSRNSTHDQS